MKDGSDVLVVSPGDSGAGHARIETANPPLDPATGPENPDVVFLLEMLALKDGRHPAAIELLTRALARDGR